MKEFLDIEEIKKKIHVKGMGTWLDKLTFSRILFVWICIVILFGLIYFFLSTNTSFLSAGMTGAVVKEVNDAVYFSFVTATTTGFGDVVPQGSFKLLAIFEVVCGLLLLALVTSKLVSIKQDRILGEIYELSLNENVTRLRSSMLLFRQNISRIMSHIETGTAKKREINDVYIYIASLEDTLNSILVIVNRPASSRYAKSIDPVNAELVVSSVVHSFDKMYELLAVLNEHELRWQREITLNLINKCININDDMFKAIAKSRIKMESAIVEDLKKRNKTLISAIQEEMEIEIKKKPSAQTRLN
ncbi:potassium channel family protein [Thermoproteota archaeon]